MFLPRFLNAIRRLCPAHHKIYPRGCRVRPWVFPHSNEHRPLPGNSPVLRTSAGKAIEGDNRHAYSETFAVNRGVVQGAIDSPWYFLLAAELLFKEADSHPDHGVDLQLPEGKLLRLEYADDAALLCRSVQEATERLTSISVIGRHSLDAEVSKPKTKAQRLQAAQKAVSDCRHPARVEGRIRRAPA